MYLDNNYDKLQRIVDLDARSDSSDGGALSLKDLLENFLSKREGRQVDLTDLFICPADSFHKESDLRDGPGSYDCRNEMSRNYSSYRFLDIKKPQNKILIGDYRSSWHDGKGSKKKKHINVLFADGHVELIPEEKWQKNLKEPLF